MLKWLLHGLVFGAGFALAFVVVTSAWYMWVFPAVLSSWYEYGSGTVGSSQSSGDVVFEPPSLDESPRFLGSQASYHDQFPHASAGTLSPGDGIIAGRVETELGPVEGLVLRLALNGKVFSEWARSGADGTYRVEVPYGEYRIDGYELDSNQIPPALHGKIDSPEHWWALESFTVEPELEGRGIHFKFVDPVVKTGPRGRISVSQEVVATWQPYPGAVSYRIQVFEAPEATDQIYLNQLFDWQSRPKVTEPRINLTELGVELKPGFQYTINVRAEDENGISISESGRVFWRSDFTVVE